tara:strand:+ start:551 stop:1108 length:558 start_codon:yes stop_codon:yes gene_type:complete
LSRFRRGASQKKPKRLHFINENIRARRIRVIDENGENLGVMDLRSALEKSKNSGLDLVLTVENSDPPVAKILDYGRFLYEKRRKEKVIKSKNASSKSQLKEIRLKLNIDKGDLEVRTKRAKKFLSQGHRVKVTVHFRKWRERIHKARGLELLEYIKEEVKDFGVVLSDIKVENTQATLMFNPGKT